jgi:Arc/MetJ-type ribon-helix-helix transcriptional regulator
MNVNIGDYYEMKLRRIIARGVAANKTEALRMAVTSFEQQLQDEEERLVLAKLEEEDKHLDRGKFVTFDQILKKYKIDKSKL